MSLVLHGNEISICKTHFDVKHFATTTHFKMEGKLANGLLNSLTYLSDFMKVHEVSANEIRYNSMLIALFTVNFSRLHHNII